ncbi:MAG: DNA replication and repair protein RecF [Clostridia bacterium]|nr:DNA replication and repair protein RecF [Clostridia bacterium]
MRIERLRLQDFRNYAEADWRPGPGVSLLVGPNGAGKTNLLEAACLLLAGQSPRTRHEEELVRQGTSAARLAAEVEAGGRRWRVEAELGPGKKRLELDGRPLARLGELLYRFPLVLFRPADLELIQAGAAVRRHFLDEVGRAWSRSYDAALGAARKALAERNALLRKLGPSASPRSAALLLETWNEAFAAAAAALLRRRLALLAELVPELRRLHAALAGEPPLSVAYASSLPAAGGLLAGGAPPAAADEGRRLEEALRGAIQKALDDALPRELEHGYTLVGPHRDDLRLQLGGRDARAYASQGQQRALALALRMAQFALLRARRGEAPLLLLDDVFSELDGERRQRLLSLLLPETEQAWVTAAEEGSAQAGGLLLAIAGSERVKWFRIVSGSIGEVPGGERTPRAPAR